MTDKGHMSRKELKEPDGFLTVSREAMAWGRGHQRMVVGAALGIAALVAVIGIGSAYRSAQRRDANADLAQAMAKLSASDYAAATAQLTAVSERWSGTAVGPLATVLAADSALRQGEIDKSLSILGGLSTASLPPFLAQQALVVWGSALEAKQQWADAAAKYKDASGIAGPYTGYAVVGEARSREMAGEKDRARELYRQAYEQFPDMPGRELLTGKFSS
ncbi:MAG: hypothetical protein U0802_19245 [Candidatus Binatia bacterium]